VDGRVVGRVDSAPRWRRLRPSLRPLGSALTGAGAWRFSRSAGREELGREIAGMVPVVSGPVFC